MGEAVTKNTKDRPQNPPIVRREEVNRIVGIHEVLLPP